MKLVLRRTLACLALLPVLLLASCQGPSARPVSYALCPSNPIFNLERENMKMAWRQEYGQTATGTLSHIYSVGDFVVAEGADHLFQVYNAADFGTYKNIAVLVGPMQVPPAILGNQLILTSSNRIFTFDVNTRAMSEGWHANMAVSVTPLIYQDSLILASASGDVARVARADGDPKWLVSIEGGILDKPVIANDVVYAVGQQDKAIALDLAKGKELWRLMPTLPSKLSSGIAVYGKNCYLGDRLGNLFCLDADFGKIEWTRPLSSPIVQVPLVVGDKLLVFTNQPSVTCLNAGGGPDVVWTFDGALELLAAGKTLAYFLTDDNCVAAVSLADGKVMWRDAMPPDTMVAGSATRPEFYIANSAGSIVAISELE